MNLRQWLIDSAVSQEEAAELFGVTAGVVNAWIKHGVPRSRRPDVIARTNGAVTFHDEVSPQEGAIRHIEAAILGFESIQVGMGSKKDRQEMQHYLMMLYRAKELIEG